jgi:hypothetical protein
MSRYTTKWQAFRAKHKNQLQLPFDEPLRPPYAPVTGPSQVILLRQPSNFPKGWWALALDDPYGWRAKHYAQWQAKRIAARLPHEITNPLPDRVPPKKPSGSEPAHKFTSLREGTSAGNAVPGQLCAPRQMTA